MSNYIFKVATIPETNNRWSEVEKVFDVNLSLSQKHLRIFNQFDTISSLFNGYYWVLFTPILDMPELPKCNEI